MHIVFGGAFNGKREFVKERLPDEQVAWLEAAMPEQVSPFTVVAGVEIWVRQQLDQGIPEEEIWQEVQTALLVNKNNRQVWILTDINRGVVPLDLLERQQRDVVGRLYQFLFKEASNITRIWYGIPEKLKGADGYEDLYENGR